MGGGAQALVVLLAVILWGLWLLHGCWARVLLFVFRDIPVWLSSPIGDPEYDGYVVAAWVTLVPCVIFGAWYGVVNGALADIGLGPTLRFIVAGVSASSLVYHYFVLHRHTRVSGPSWFRYQAASSRLKLDLRLKYIEETFRLRLWLGR